MSNKNEKTHWLSNPNKNFIGHWDLPDGKDLVLTIKSAGFEEVENPKKSSKNNPHIEIKKVVRWEEDYKPLIVNAINSENLRKATGVKYMEDSVGKKVALYVSSEKFRFSSEKVDCIRIRKTVPKPKKTGKKTMSPKSFAACIEAVKKGTVKAVQVRKEYELTPEQETQLKALKNG